MLYVYGFIYDLLGVNLWRKEFLLIGNVAKYTPERSIFIFWGQLCEYGVTARGACENVMLNFWNTGYVIET